MHGPNKIQNSVLTEASSARIRVDSAVLRRFPTYRVHVVLAFGVRNGPSDSASAALLQSAARETLGRLGSAGMASDARIAGWRDIYRQLGIKASSYPSSVEALLRRALKGGPESLPCINRLVDVYNAISLRHVLPVGGEDLDRLSGQLVLRFATGQEPSDVPDQADGSASLPERDEVIWADDLGVTCRRWNWRQGRRTRLTEATTNAYFIVEGLASASSETDLGFAVSELCDQILGCGGHPRIEIISFG